MRKFQSISFLVIIFCIALSGCDFMAELFHGPKPEPEKVPRITVMQGDNFINNSGDFNFNKTGLNISKSFKFTVNNTGEADLVFNSIESNKIKLLDNETDYFSVQLLSSLGTIVPGNSIEFELHFNPAMKGNNYSAIVQIETNCRSNPDFSFVIFGSCAEIKTEIITLTTSLNFDSEGITNIYPVTVDIYAGGAGGGGAGGHWREGGNFGLLSDYYSAGGAGGGGAVVYRKIEIFSNTTFEVSLGNGGGNGNGGVSYYSNKPPLTGNNGNDGGNTTINWNGGAVGSIIAAGGRGGKGGGPNTIGTGGEGGSFSQSGANSGANGGASGTNGSAGTQAGSGINSSFQGSNTNVGIGGSFNNYSAGNGGYGGNANKSPGAGGGGANGGARIIFTWYE